LILIYGGQEGVLDDFKVQEELHLLHLHVMLQLGQVLQLLL
jgi:hypothetical protein